MYVIRLYLHPHTHAALARPRNAAFAFGESVCRKQQVRCRKLQQLPRQERRGGSGQRPTNQRAKTLKLCSRHFVVGCYRWCLHCAASEARGGAFCIDRLVPLWQSYQDHRMIRGNGFWEFPA